MKNTETLSPILYVDDEESNLVVFNSAFRRYYEIHLASSGYEGLEIIKKHPIQLIITDQRMPEMTGIQFLEKVIPDYPDSIRMILTGFSDIEVIIQAINTGRVYQYITKPWNTEELKMHIDKGLETFHLREQNRILLDDLKEANRSLEKKVIERTRKIESQKKEIMDSIHYASRIQNALFPQQDDIVNFIPSSFILNKPKDIVSGDYFWLALKDNKVVIAVADCTGHGVPGAFMSILGITFLNEIINKTVIIRANEVLNQLRGLIMKSLHQTGNNIRAKDGMEIALSIIDLRKNKIQFSGAFRPLYLVRDNELHEIEGDKMPIGIYDDDDISFTNKDITIMNNDIIYLFSDGYVDQTGGKNRKTYKSHNFKKLLLEIHKKPMQEQKELLEKNLDEWRGDIDQVDDILVFGIKIP